MKKLFCTAMCLLMALCLTACKDSNKSQPIELVSRTLDSEHEFAIVDGEGNEWLNGDDVKNVLVMYKEGENRYLEFRFTKDGAKKFKKAVKKNKNGTLSITLDGEVVASPVVANEKNSSYAKFTDSYDTLIDCFNKLT